VQPTKEMFGTYILVKANKQFNVLLTVIGLVLLKTKKLRFTVKKTTGFNQKNMLGAYRYSN
jgi:hypothetical protein